jgi:hypothetical protein
VINEYTLAFNPSDELGSNIKAYVSFTEMSATATGLAINSEFVGATADTVKIKITYSPTTMTILAGYVIIYNGDSSK